MLLCSALDRQQWPVILYILHMTICMVGKLCHILIMTPASEITYHQQVLEQLSLLHLPWNLTTRTHWQSTDLASDDEAPCCWNHVSDTRPLPLNPSILQQSSSTMIICQGCGHRTMAPHSTVCPLPCLPPQMQCQVAALCSSLVFVLHFPVLIVNLTLLYLKDSCKQHLALVGGLCDIWVYGDN